MNSMSDRAFLWNIILIVAITVFSFSGFNFNVNEYEGGFFVKSIFRPSTIVVLFAWFTVILSWIFFFNNIAGCIVAWWIMVICGSLLQFVFTGGHKDSPYWTRFYDWEHYSENSGVPPNDKLENPHSEYVMPEWLNANKDVVKKHIKDCGCTLEQLEKEAKEHKLFFSGFFENLTGQEKTALGSWIHMRRQYDDETYGKEFYEADTKEKRIIAGRLYIDEIKKLLEPRSNRYCMISFYDCLLYNYNGQLQIWRWDFNSNTKVKSK